MLDYGQVQRNTRGPCDPEAQPVHTTKTHHELLQQATSALLHAHAWRGTKGPHLPAWPLATMQKRKNAPNPQESGDACLKPFTTASSKGPCGTRNWLGISPCLLHHVTSAVVVRVSRVFPQLFRTSLALIRVAVRCSTTPPRLPINMVFLNRMII